MSKNKLYVDVVVDSSSDQNRPIAHTSDSADADEVIDSREIILRPSMASVPIVPFIQVRKKMIIGNALKLGINNYFKAIIENFRD